MIPVRMVHSHGIIYAVNTINVALGMKVVRHGSKNFESTKTSNPHILTTSIKPLYYTVNYRNLHTVNYRNLLTTRTKSFHPSRKESHMPQQSTENKNRR